MIVMILRVLFHCFLLQEDTAETLQKLAEKNISSLHSLHYSHSTQSPLFKVLQMDFDWDNYLIGHCISSGAMVV